VSLFMIGKFLKSALSNRFVQIGLVVALLVFAGSRAWAMYQHEKQERVLAQLALQTQIDVIQDGVARIAHGEMVRDSVTHLLDAAQKLNGKLVAALTIAVAEQQVVYIHDTLPTETDSAGTRTAHVRDSTALGILDATITAPLPPANLGLRYTFTRPAFAPQVGFVEVGDSIVAVVWWEDTEVRVGVPFFKRYPKPLPLFGGFGEMNYLFTDKVVEARVGGVVRGRHLSGQAFGYSDFTTAGLGAGLRYEF